ncbi:hypothetical protein CLG96_03925 [Sphingomonas oleivorans]|uniref:FecR protein domain-containing protein n=2 Tax=Sphingomonas oleivorans TaxID=1735121 RepID=A0A2T5G2A3_9SPHN|nr:hypothetical protein CLG96_03925 [Sphingomonas oleivorans]
MRWIAADPAHAVAFARAEAGWDMADRLRASPPPLIGVAEPETQDSPAERHPTRRAVAAGLLAASAAAVAVPFGWKGFDGSDIYETKLGERRSLLLPDGSKVRLNTASRIRIAMTAERRTIHLLQGEALFDVAHDAARPFFVEVAQGWIRAIGTAFNVRIRKELVELTVTEGIVALGHEGQAHKADDEPRVAAGAGAVLRRGTVATTQLDHDLIRQRIAWRDGLLDLEGNTIEQAVAEFNRYRPDQIVVGDPRIASIRIGGRFELDEGDKFLLALQRSFPVRTVKGADGSILLLSLE